MRKKMKIFYLFFVSFFLLAMIILFVQIVGSEHFIENEIGQSAFDQFSVGHFVTGIILGALCLMYFNLYFRKKMDFKSMIIFSFLFTLVISIGFEIIENSPVIVNSGLKFNNRADSTLNSTIDIILNMFGYCLISFIYWNLFKNKYYSYQNYKNVK